MVQEKDKPKMQNPLTLLADAISEYKGYLQPGDVARIVELSGQKKRTVDVYLNGTVSKLEHGRPIFEAMKKIVKDREKEIRKLVA